MRETLIMLVLGAGTFCAVCMVSRLRALKYVKRRTILEKLRQQGF